MSGQEVQGLPDLRTNRSFCHSDGKMLFAGRKRRKFRMSDDHAGWDAGIGGYCLVASIAGDDPRMRTAHHARQNERRRLVAIFLGELLQAGGVAIDDGSGRDAMDETAAAKALSRRGSTEMSAYRR